MVKHKILWKSTKTNSPTGDSDTTSLTPVGVGFTYKETTSKNHGIKVFVGFERTYIIQISIVTFYCNRISILSNDSLKSMGRFRNQLLLENKTWSTRYNIPKNDRCSNSPTQWTKLSSNFTAKNCGIKILDDETDGAQADMCFSKITITHFVY